MKTHRRRNRQQLLLFLLIFVAVLFFEEYNYGKIDIFMNNHYKNAVYLPIERERTGDIKLPVAVVVIVDQASRFNEYKLAQDSLSCYCQHYSYPIIRLSLDQEPDLVAKCPQRDFMFQRHCVVREMLLRNPRHRYFYFLDADIGVVNPNHLLEDYINIDADVTFYERIFNFEFMAGSYIVRNTPFAQILLKQWAEYENKLPKSFHGTDNAAIHQLFLNRFKPKKATACRSIWEASEDWEGVWKYVACARFHLGTNYTRFFPIDIRQKGSELTWVRDGWLTNSRWASRDFMFHGWQAARLDTKKFARWFNPFVPSDSETGFQLNRCSSKLSMLNWAYKDTFISTDEKINEIIRKEIEKVKREFEKYTGNL